MNRVTQVVALIVEHEIGQVTYATNLDPELTELGTNPTTEERIAVAILPGVGAVPLVRAYPEDAPLDRLVDMGRQTATATGQRLEVVRFTLREHCDWIDP